MASLFGALPIGMFGLAILLLGRETTGSFAYAGRVVAAFGFANAFGAIAQGRLMDRLGQPRVLRVAAVVHAAALAALLLAAEAGASTLVLCACAVVAGACLPQLPAAMRSLWGMLVPDEDARRTAYALVSIVFEVSVISAPVIVAGVVAVASPSAAVLVALVASAGGALAFSLTHASRRWRGEPHEVGWLGPLEAPGMRVTLAVLTSSASRSGSSRSRRPPSWPSAARRRPAGCCWPRCRAAASSAGSSTAPAPGRAAGAPSSPR